MGAPLIFRSEEYGKRTLEYYLVVREGLSASLRCLPLLTDVWRLKNGTEISGAEEFRDERELDKR